uniref:Uncharacterized protein n=1 Tax=Anguilla anguilla TaxID=7936 RepID=A0A0E9VW09_ANGAN
MADTTSFPQGGVYAPLHRKVKLSILCGGKDKETSLCDSFIHVSLVSNFLICPSRFPAAILRGQFYKTSLCG